MNTPPTMIGIAGPSCSGKTSLASRIAATLGQRELAIVSLDRYFFDMSKKSPKAIARHNFDNPAALDVAYLKNQLQAIAAGMSVYLPSYDFSTHSRTNQLQLFSPPSIVLVEGLHTFYWQEIRSLLHLRIFIDCDDSTALDRRLRRDVCQRGRTVESITKQFEQTVSPSTKQFIQTRRAFSHIQLDGTLPLATLYGNFRSELRLHADRLKGLRQGEGALA